MSDIYEDSHRQLQDRFDTRRLADRLDETLVRSRFTEKDREFIERLDMFFLASVDHRGRANCSYKGGEPGLVRVIDDATLAFPNYDGNGMYLSTGNMLGGGQVGLLFIDFGRQSRLRVNGEARVRLDDPLMPAYPDAQFIVRVAAREIFPNCPRYIHKMQLVERSRFVPRAGCAVPVPGWKKNSWAEDVLPADDPARDSAREVRDR
jgi:predicted pyridoxine 5'-phosphate oxidase superfamily flavin-nucleotide-binding protein